MIALYDNHVLTATITADTTATGYIWDTALQDTRLSRKGRTTDNDGWIKFDLATAKQVDYICIKNHNFTATAVITLEGHTSDSWADPDYSQVLTYAETITAAVDDELRWWRITVTDAALTYLEVAYVFLGEYMSMPGMDQAQVLARKSTSSTDKSSSLQLYGDKKDRYKSAEIFFPYVSNTVRLALETMFDVVDTVTPFIIIFWESDLTVEPALYCNFTKDLDFKRVRGSGAYWSLAISIEECK